MAAVEHHVREQQAYVVALGAVQIVNLTQGYEQMGMGRTPLKNILGSLFLMIVLPRGLRIVCIRVSGEVSSRTLSPILGTMLSGSTQQWQCVLRATAGPMGGVPGRRLLSALRVVVRMIDSSSHCLMTDVVHKSIGI